MQKEKLYIYSYTIILSTAIIIIISFLWGNDNIIVQYLREINGYIKDIRTLYFPSFKTSIDDFLQFVPAVLFLIMTLCKCKGNMDNKSFLIFILITTAITQLIIYILKISVGEIRPDTTDALSFPSGHTTTAFMTATILYIQYNKRSIWFTFFGYSCATAVGCMRILNNRHWLLDVVTGAILGIIITLWTYNITIRILHRITADNNK